MQSQRSPTNFFGQDSRKRLLLLRNNDWNTLRVERFVCSLSKSSECLSRSGTKSFERMNLVFVH